MAVFDFIEQNGVGSGFVYKNTTNAYYFNGTTFNAITSVNYPTTTVRGIVYLDGTYYVMTPAGSIYGSALEDPTTWSALNVIQSRMEPDGGVCLARQLNMVVAFSSYSTEFFYDAGNPTGSPLLSFPSAFLEIGCASANSVAQVENTIFFMGVSKTKGRSVYRLDGTTQSQVSTSAIDRILNADSLADVSAYCIKLSGHGFYFLTLRTLGITLVYDFTSGSWAKWTQLALSATKSITAATWANGQVTATVATHGYSDGDYVVVASSNPTGYNYSGVINVVDANTFTYPIATTLTAYVGSATSAIYVETYFNMASYTSGGGFDLVQDSTTGYIYAVDTATYLDGSNPIKFKVRTAKWDAGDNKTKFFPRVEVIGDKVASTSYLRYSNDDYQTWSAYRPVDMSLQRSKLDRLGKGRRRAFDMINYDNQPIRIESLELSVEEGTN